MRTTNTTRVMPWQPPNGNTGIVPPDLLEPDPNTPIIMGIDTPSVAIQDRPSPFRRTITTR